MMKMTDSEFRSIVEYADRRHRASVVVKDKEQVVEYLSFDKGALYLVRTKGQPQLWIAKVSNKRSSTAWKATDLSTGVIPGTTAFEAFNEAVTKWWQ
jgi:hypothetical protein